MRSFFYVVIAAALAASCKQGPDKAAPVAQEAPAIKLAPEGICRYLWRALA